MNIVFNGFGGVRRPVGLAIKAHMRALRFGVPFHITTITCGLIPDAIADPDIQRFGAGRLLIILGDVTKTEDAFFDAGPLGTAPAERGMDVRFDVPIPVVIPQHFIFPERAMRFNANDFVSVVLVNANDNAGANFNNLSSLNVYGDIESSQFDAKLR